MTETAYDTSEAADFLPLSPPILKIATREGPTQWAERLLAPGTETTWSDELRRLVTAGALSSIYGLALGVREGPGAMVHHALSVPVAPLTVCLVAAPAFAILLALADASIEPLELARATTRAFAHTGLVLAGLAPCVALFMATADEPESGAIVGAIGLLAAGLLGLRAFAWDMARSLRNPSTRFRIATVLFMLFVLTLAARIWSVSLAGLGGAS
jgi:hypothetical protein